MRGPEPDLAPAELGCHGLPLWIAREAALQRLGRAGLGFGRIVALEKMHRISDVTDLANLVWSGRSVMQSDNATEP